MPKLYQNLDIITNKATNEEMDNIEHHLIGYLDSDCITNTVIDYKNKAINLIDQMLDKSKIPIVVGGTHYYIQSILYESLIDEPAVSKQEECNLFTNKQQSNDINYENSSLYN